MKKEKIKITKEKRLELIEELKKLNEVTLKEISDRLEETRKNSRGDDNTQLGEIFEEQEATQRRISEINDILDNMVILKEKTYCDPLNVKVGSTVKLRQGDRVFDVKIVSSLEADPEQNYLSNTSPLGKMILKSKVGDIIKVKIRNNVTEYKILDIC